MTRRDYLRLRGYITRLEELAHSMHVLELEMGALPEAAGRLRSIRAEMDQLRDDLRKAAHGPLGTVPPASS